MKKILLAAMLVFGMLVSISAFGAFDSEFEKVATPENAVLVYGFVTYDEDDGKYILFTNFDTSKEYVSSISKIKAFHKFKSQYKFHEPKITYQTVRILLIPVEQRKETPKSTAVFWGLAYPDSNYSLVYFYTNYTGILAGVGYESDIDFKTPKETGTLYYAGDKGVNYKEKNPIDYTKEEIKAYKSEETEAKIEALKTVILPKFKKGTHWYDVIQAEIKKLEGELKDEK